MGASLRDLRACAQKHLADYTDPSGKRAFRTYDRLGDPNVLSPLDCLAPVLLSVRLSHGDIIPMFEESGAAADLRRAMEAVVADPATSHAEFREVDLDSQGGPWGLVRAALRASEGVHAMTAVAVSKILHRKRPRLVPIYDSQLYSFYLGKRPSGRFAPSRFWRAIQDDLRADETWTFLAELVDGRCTPDNRPLSELRAADIVVWEHQVTGCRS